MSPPPSHEKCLEMQKESRPEIFVKEDMNIPLKIYVRRRDAPRSAG